MRNLPRSLVLATLLALAPGAVADVIAERRGSVRIDGLYGITKTGNTERMGGYGVEAAWPTAYRFDAVVRLEGWLRDVAYPTGEVGLRGHSLAGGVRLHLAPNVSLDALVGGYTLKGSFDPVGTDPAIDRPSRSGLATVLALDVRAANASAFLVPKGRALVTCRGDESGLGQLDSNECWIGGAVGAFIGGSVDGRWRPFAELEYTRSLDDGGDDRALGARIGIVFGL